MEESTFYKRNQSDLSGLTLKFSFQISEYFLILIYEL
jgi:hypothetical protein